MTGLPLSEAAATVDDGFGSQRARAERGETTGAGARSPFQDDDDPHVRDAFLFSQMMRDGAAGNNGPWFLFHAGAGDLGPRPWSMAATDMPFNIVRIPQ